MVEAFVAALVVFADVEVVLADVFVAFDAFNASVVVLVVVVVSWRPR